MTDIELEHRIADIVSRHAYRSSRVVARAIIAELALKQEWGVQITEDGKTVIETHPGKGESMDRDTAFYENERWKGYSYNTEGVRSRWTTEWVSEVD